MPIKTNSVQSDPAAAKLIQNFLEESKKSIGQFMAESFASTSKKIAEQQKAQKKKSNDKVKKLGAVSISNTDGVSKCIRLKAALNAKLAEIYASGADDKLKDALARDVMMQLQKVETKIVEIQRREKALAEEKKVKRKETEFEKRRRKYDKEKRTALIKRQYLYSAEEGGLDPNDYMPSMPGLGGDIGVVSNVGGGEISLGDGDVAVSAGSDAGGGSVDVSVGGGSVCAKASFEAVV